MAWNLMQLAPALRKPTLEEATATFLLLLPLLYSLVYRLYAKIRRRDRRVVGLHILSEASPDHEPKYEIVAVHGLGADPEHTWTCKASSRSNIINNQQRVHLLKDLLMKDERFAEARILHFAYNADWLVDACFESAHDIGLRLMESLVKHRNKHARLPLIFVGHSFGGIVIKEALSINKDDTEKILEDTCGIIFLGTPHLGSPIAGYGATIAYLTGFLGSDTGLLLSLRSSGRLLRKLSEVFQRSLYQKKEDLGKETRIISICEQKPTYLLNWLYAGMIVPSESATFGTNFMQVFHVYKDHSGLNKCSGPEDPLYKELTTQLRKIQPNAPPKINKLQQAVIDRLTPVIAPEAEYHPSFDEDGRGRMECLPQTRVELLDDICNWLDDFDSAQKHLYWLQGKAGTGKSTIARTVVSRMTQRKRIVANFFFKRGEGDRARLKRFFTTLSAQLVRKLPSFAMTVQDALESEPSLPEQDPRVQFRKLVQEPLQKQNFGPHKAIVVVVDALDECDSREDLETLVQQLSQSIVHTQGDQSSPRQLLVKYFVTSRLDYHTQSGFNGVSEEIYEKTELERVTSETTKQDIECYLKVTLQKIDGFLEPLPDSGPWSNPADVEILEKLTDRASPLFEFAAAACRFIGQTTMPGEPRDLLQDILESSVYGDLDGVYLPIMNRRFFDLNKQNRVKAEANFRKVIGSVLSLADYITIPCLGKILGQSEAAVRKELLHFRSVLVVPEKQSSSMPISLFHESFRDFLIGPEANQEFKIDSAKAHTLLATRCIKLLRGALEQNICRLKSPGRCRSEVAEETIQMSLPQEVQYACRFWIYHLTKCGLHPSDGDDWHTFLSSHFLHLLEALSWLGRTSETLSMVRELKTVTHSTDAAQMRAFLDDADRFILYFHQMIDTAPLQLYSSALTFSPTNSIIRRTFDACRPRWIVRKPVVGTTWSSCLRTLRGHGDRPTCVAFSPQGILASGDKTGYVKIWDPISGSCLQTLCTASWEDVTTMAFSESGNFACRTVKSISLWDVSQLDYCRKLFYYNVRHVPEGDWPAGSLTFKDEQTLLFTKGDLVKALKWGQNNTSEDYWNKCESRPFLSSDGEWVACKGQGEIRVFNIRCEERHLSGVKMDSSEYVSPSKSDWVRFSPDSQYLAAIVDKQTIKIWDVASTVCLQTLNGEGCIYAATFSPDGRWIATGDEGGKIFIWDWKEGTRLSVLTGHSDSISSLAFSPDGAWLASGSFDDMVKIWDLSAEAYKGEMLRHHWFYSSIAIAMNSRRFVTSDGFASAYRLWDDYGKACVTVPFPTGNKSVISADGSISAAFQYAHLELRDVETGSSLPTPLHDYLHIKSIALSANGEKLVIASEDGRIGLWESRTAKLLKEMRRRKLCIWPTVAISADGEQVASCMDGSIWIEDSTGNELTSIETMFYPFSKKLGFSPRGDRLAAVFGYSSGAIWDCETGACLRTFEKDVSNGFWSMDMSFIDFDFAFDIDADIRDKPPWDECLIRHHLSPDGKWIMRHSEKLLWLPPEYQPVAAAVSGSNIAILRGLGDPYLIGLSDDGLTE